MHSRVFLALLLLFFGLFTSAFAQTISLDSLVVTATRTVQDTKQIPANVTVITQEEIAQAQPKSVADLLRGKEGVIVKDYTGNGKNVTVDLRGFGETAGSNTLVLVDGRRVNAIDLSGTDWTLIPIAQIERIEIVRGTGSVLYGDNAVGGVINIITKSPTEGLKVTAHGEIGSYDMNKENILVSGGSAGFAGMFSLGREETDGYRDNSYFDANNWNGQLTYYPQMGNLSMRINGGGHSDEFGMPGALDETMLRENRRAAKTPDDYAETQEHYWQWSGEYDANNFGRMSLDLGWRQRDSKSHWISSFYEAKSELDTLSISPHYEIHIPILNADNHLIAGVDVYQHELDSDSTYSSGEVDRDSVGAYIHDDISVSKDLTVALGYRYERVEFDMKQVDLSGFLSPLDDSTDSDEQAWEIGSTYQLNSDSAIFARVNKSFRIPLADELVVYDYTNGSQTINPDLKTQTDLHVEVGARSELTSRISGNVTLFQIRTDDEIFYNPLAYANENYPETLRRGVELGANYTLTENIVLSGTYSYLKAEFVKDSFDGNSVPGVPKQSGNLTLSLQDMLPGFDALVAYNYVGSSYAISDQENQWKKVESYGTVDLNLSYKKDYWKLFASVKNLFNEKYSEWVVANYLGLNYYPAPERNFVAGLELTF